MISSRKSYVSILDMLDAGMYAAEVRIFVDKYLVIAVDPAAFPDDKLIQFIAGDGSLNGDGGLYGDGDGYGIGVGHFIHAMRRNLNPNDRVQSRSGL